VLSTRSRWTRLLRLCAVLGLAAFLAAFSLFGVRRTPATHPLSGRPIAAIAPRGSRSIG